VLTIAGSDPGGGAGIQADLRAFDHMGLYGISVITALTAQNTQGVQAVFPVPALQVKAQLNSVTTDLDPAAAKTGMLPTVDIIEEVADVAAAGELGILVVDPVTVSTSGAILSDKECAGRLVSHLLPHCRLVTPNLEEAGFLTGRKVTDEAAAMDAARALVAAGAGAACVTGGHWPGSPTDYLFDGDSMYTLAGSRIETSSQVHGTGCLFSAAATSCLAQGDDILESVKKAKQLVEQAIVNAFSPGKGMKALSLIRRY
jgi:hydroxymethylpyrimidine/phosphomethylpyrimidine kinase